jgi:AraC-like DNA-binding protein
MIRSLARIPTLASIPFIFIPRDSGVSGPIAGSPALGLADLLDRFAAAPGAGRIIIFDPDTDRGAALAASLSGGAEAAETAETAGTAEAAAAGSLQEVAALQGRTTPSLIIVRSADAAVLASLRTSVGGAANRLPLILFLCDLLDEGFDALVLESDPRSVLLNDGVLNPSELRRFVADLAEGKAALPPFTGVIVKRAQHYLNRHLADSVTRWKVADEANVSEDYLTRIFKKELGLSPWDYLIRLRVQAARKLLRESSESIHAVAAATGFQDQAYFCRVFRKVEGRTPSAFRAAPSAPPQHLSDISPPSPAPRKSE